MKNYCEPSRKLREKAKNMKARIVPFAALGMAILMASAVRDSRHDLMPEIEQAVPAVDGRPGNAAALRAASTATITGNTADPASEARTPATAAEAASRDAAGAPVAAARQAGPSGARRNARVEAGNAESYRSSRSKMSGPVAALAAAGGSGLVEIVARYDERPEFFDDEYVESLGGEVTRAYATLDMRAIRIPASSLEALAVSENVDWLSLDDRMSATGKFQRVVNLPTSASPNSAYTGSSVGIAILDTGVASHGDLGNNVVQYSFLNGAYPVPTISNGEMVARNDNPRVDDFGHGTHVAGILTGSGTSSGGNYKGIGSQAPVLSLQVLDGSGSGSMSDVMAALDWLLVYGHYYDVRVVNLSLGKGITESNTTDPLVLAVEELWDAGFVVVVAAGNDGYAGAMTVNSPANSRKVITVGSLTDRGTDTDFSDDYVSSYSSVGPTVGDLVMKPDLVAPGNRIVAAIPKVSALGTYLPSRLIGCVTILGVSTCKDAYLELSGTSMAAPVVAASAALLLEKDPTLSPATVKARLMHAARKLNQPATAIGSGLLDVDAALSATGTVSGEALSPLVTFDAELNATVIQDTADLWGGEDWSASYIYSGGASWTAGAGTTDGGITANGYGWTDGGISARGYGWTNAGIGAKGYGWTDGGVHAKGYGWTDGGVETKSLLEMDSSGMVLNDDPVPSP